MRNNLENITFITRNEYGDLVCMSIHVYEEMVEKFDVQKKLFEGIKEIHKGKVIDGQTFLKTLMEKYGK